jgi:hypothetical protein
MMEKEATAIPRPRGAAEPARTLMRKCDCPAGAPCSCADQESMQRSASGPAPAGGIPAVVGQVTGAGGGAPLDPSLRERFEPRFGVDFGSVRIHTGPRATESARAVNALAYTVGRDIVFADGHYAPHTERGARLLAHELTHVVQQGGDAVSPGTVDAVSEASDPSEHEADEVAGEVMR